MSQGKAFVNALDVARAEAASRIAPGCLVTRSASLTVKVNTTSEDEQFMGVAGDLSLANDADPGMWSQYDPIPVGTIGRFRLRLLGGGTDCVGGMWLQAARDGLVEIESSGDRTLQSVAKCVEAEDIEVSNYSTAITTAAAGATTVTVSATTYFADGDYVNLKDDGGSENALILSVDSSTVVTVAKALAATYSATPTMSKLVECEAILQ